MSPEDRELSGVFQQAVKRPSSVQKTPQKLAQDKASIVEMDTGQRPNQHVQDSIHTTIQDKLIGGVSSNGMTYSAQLNGDAIEVKGTNNDSKVIIRIIENKNDPMISNIDVSGKIDPMLMKQVLSDINSVVGGAGIKAQANDRGRIESGAKGQINTKENQFFSKHEKRKSDNIAGEEISEKVLKSIASDVIKEKNPEKAAEIRMLGHQGVKLEPWMEELMKQGTAPSGSVKVAGDIEIVEEAMGLNGLSQRQSLSRSVSSPNLGIKNHGR